jgi:Ni/Fe-hydrogenase 1 B-type cytochrome subunit
MAVIEPVRMDLVRPGKFKKYSPSLRLWHWLNTIIISGSLITVLINATITDRRTSSAIIKTELQQSGASVNDDQVKNVAHALSDSVWDVHKYFGYCLAGLLLFRLILELFQMADQKFIRTLKSAYIKYNAIKKDRETARHELAVKLIYSAFYIILLTMAVTGLFLAFEDELRAYKAIRHSVKEVHNFCMYLILAFITVHLAGVFLAERKNSKGIVSDMINGGGADA